MADPAAFAACLNRLGFNAPTRVFIAGQGFNTIDDFVALPLAEVDRMIKMFIKTPVPPVPAGDPQVNFPYLAQRRLKALRMWCDYRTARGQPVAPAAFTAAESTRFLDRMAEVDAFKRAADDDDMEGPGDLKSMTEWPTWEEKWIGYLAKHRSTYNQTPLTYTMREADMVAVTNESRAATYATIDEDLIRNTVHAGPHYITDYRRAWDLFKPTIIDGPGWTYVKQYNRTKNFPAAFLALKAQAEGTAAKQTRKAKAYAEIATARYTGRSRYTFDQYVARHQRAHNELEELEEPVAETKKVADFLKGISDSKLETGKNIVDGDPNKLGDFQACQQYFKTLVENAKTRTDPSSRNILAAYTRKDKGKKNNKRKGGGGNSTDYLPPAEYSKLSNEEKLALKKRRENKENAGGGDGKKTARFIESAVRKAIKDAISNANNEDEKEEDVEPARKISKTQVSFEKEKDSKEEPPKKGEDDAKTADSVKDDSAAAQFGRFAHRAEKLKRKEQKKQNKE